MVKTERRIAFLLVAAAIGLGGRAAAQEGAGTLPLVTIKEAVDSALSSGEERKIVDGNLEAARAAYDLARSKKAVSLSGSGSYSLTDAFGADLSGPAASALSRTVGSKGASHSVQGSLALSAGANSKLTLSATESIPPSPGAASTSLGLSLAQTIWDGYPGGQAEASFEKAAISFKGKELDSMQSRSGIAAGAKKAYVTMLTAQRTVALRASALEKQSASLKLIEATYALQQSSSVDMMNARVSARSAELDLTDASHGLEIARRKLAALMGRDPALAFAVAELEAPELPAPSIEEAVAVGLERRSDAAKNALSRRSAAIDLALARAAALPSVSASAGLKMGIAGGSTPGEAYQASLGVSVSMPILDSGAAESQAAQASSQVRILEAQADQLARSIESDIRDLYWSAASLRDRIAVAADARDIAEKKLEIVETQLRFGTATNQDLFDAQAAAAKAGSDYLAAMGTYFLKEIDLETAMGL